MRKGLSLVLTAAIYLLFCLTPAHALIPGDVNNDSNVNLADIIYLVNYIFKGGPSPVLQFAGDVNANCLTNLSDLIYLVNYVFKSGPDPEGCPPWGVPQNLGPPVNTEGAVTPAISADGNTLYFSRVSDIYYSTWSGSSWSTPAPVPGHVNTIYYEAKPFVTADGKKLYFESERPGGMGNDDIWVSTWDSVNNEWGVPVNLGPPVNNSNENSSPSLTADNAKLFFLSGVSIRVSNWNGTGWDPPVILGSGVNANATEDDPNISSDGKTLYFIRWNFYGPQIYVSYFVNGDWSIADTLPSPVNDSFSSLSPSISYDGMSLYFSSGLRPPDFSASPHIFVTRRQKTVAK